MEENVFNHKCLLALNVDPKEFEQIVGVLEDSMFYADINTTKKTIEFREEAELVDDLELEIEIFLVANGFTDFKFEIENIYN